ncbi:MAG: VCBS repeat-containing protein [Nitrospinota bacterium]|nr:MAG: VCBS repeat-containing protein [Nitrospinota bacterium]
MHLLRTRWCQGEELSCFLLLVLCIGVGITGAAGTPLFSRQDLTVPGKILTVLPVDLQGKGTTDLLVAHKTGVYPEERRWLSLFRYQVDRQRYASTADQQWEVDPDVTLIDVGDVAPAPGKEILYLTTRGLRYVAQEKDGTFSSTSHPLLSLPTFTIFPETGELLRGRFFADWKGTGHPLLLLPQPGSLRFFAPAEGYRWQEVEAVTVSPRTFLFSAWVDDGLFRDYSFQAAYRLPRIVVQDFNGDGRVDLLLPQQEYLRVHLQQDDGHFSSSPSFQLIFPVRSPAERSQQSLLLYLTPADVNQDGLADVILTKVTGKLLERRVEIFLFLHQPQAASPFSSTPQQKMALKGFTPGVTLQDLDDDGKKDLCLSYVHIGLWGIIKNLLSNRVTVVTDCYRLQANLRFATHPTFHLKTSYRIDLSDGIRIHGIWPTWQADFTGDGRTDLLIARDGEVMIYAKTPGGSLASTPLVQAEVPVSPYRHIGDMNGDGRNDLLFYERGEGGKITLLLRQGR